jgi:hypothetical protein
MSTNGMTSWAVDLNDIGAVYPFQGWEGLMLILGLVFWIGFHVLQIRNEQQELRYEQKADLDDVWTRDAIAKY